MADETHACLYRVGWDSLRAGFRFQYVLRRAAAGAGISAAGGFPRISGRVTATVFVASDGSLQTKASGHPLLAPAVEKAIRASVFLKACGGKSVTLVFNFVLSENLDTQRVSFGYPNQFWISVGPRLVQP